MLFDISRSTAIYLLLKINFWQNVDQCHCNEIPYHFKDYNISRESISQLHRLISPYGRTTSLPLKKHWNISKTKSLGDVGRRLNRPLSVRLIMKTDFGKFLCLQKGGENRISKKRTPQFSFRDAEINMMVPSELLRLRVRHVFLLVKWAKLEDGRSYHFLVMLSMVEIALAEMNLKT